MRRTNTPAGVGLCSAPATDLLPVPTWLNVTGGVPMCPPCLRDARRHLTALPG